MFPIILSPNHMRVCAYCDLPELLESFAQRCAAYRWGHLMFLSATVFLSLSLALTFDLLLRETEEHCVR